MFNFIRLGIIEIFYILFNTIQEMSTLYYFIYLYTVLLTLLSPPSRHYTSFPCTHLHRCSLPLCRANPGIIYTRSSLNKFTVMESGRRCLHKSRPWAPRIQQQPRGATYSLFTEHCTSVLLCSNTQPRAPPLHCAGNIAPVFSCALIPSRGLHLSIVQTTLHQCSLVL